MARPDRFASSKAEQKLELDELEEEIEEMNAAYRRYFNGVDNLPPVRDHEQLKRKVRLFTGRSFRSSEHRFRFQGLRARLVTYEQYWTRIMIRIERGTHKRILAESRVRQAKIDRGRGHELDRLKGAESLDLGMASGDDAIAAAMAAATEAVEAKRAAPRRPPSGSPSARPQLPEGVDAGAARRLFKDFVAAKKAAGQSTDGLTYGALVKKLARDVPKLREKIGNDRKIEFEVVNKDGNVRLRAKR